MPFFVKYPRIDIDRAVVAVTGGARGIGRATAARFVATGAAVVLGDRDLEAATATAEELGCQALALDVGSRESFAGFRAAIESAHGPISILVNNAGVMPLGNFLDEADSVTATQINVNLWGPINGMREVLPGMIERRRGHVVNVASLAGKMPTPGGSVYSATKHAVVGLSASVRDEVADHGVSVTTILPSLVNTDLGAGLSMPAAVTVEPEDIAAAIVESTLHRRAEIVIPGWLGAAERTSHLLPNSVLQGLRRQAGGAELSTEANADPRRAEYLTRLGKQVSDA